MDSKEPMHVSIPPLPPLKFGRTSLQVFLTSLYAFLLRELKNQYGRSRLGYFWALAEPAATVGVLLILHGMLGGAHALIYGERPSIFFLFGAVPYFLYFNAVTQAQGVCVSQKGLFNYRQIKPIDIIIARCLIDALSLLGVLALFLLAWKWSGQPLNLYKPLELTFALFTLFVLGLSQGLVFEVFGTVFPDLKKVFAIVNRPMFFISGLFFSMEMIPEGFEHFLIWNPVLHAVDLARDSVMPAYSSPGSWNYVWSVILVLQFVGLSSYRRYLYRLI